MNDFTKEELEDLWSYIRVFLGNYKYPDNHTGYALMHKIQSMIDNYCEIKIPTMDDYVCFKCNEEWHQCECKK